MRKEVMYLRLSEKEKEMLQRLMEYLEFEKASEWFRYVLRKEWEKLRREEYKDEKGDEPE